IKTEVPTAASSLLSNVEQRSAERAGPVSQTSSIPHLAKQALKSHHLPNAQQRTISANVL
ncbi:MAG TPA: hypothetical protein VFJ59_02350, partial [Pseudolabrys sp.]|nr:hypothetical protein [Pseudolabrys sp.]